MKLLILNGPNLNLLGVREPGIYGNDSMESYLETLRKEFPQVEIEYFQSNIPEFLSTDGGGALFTCFGSKVCEQYDRIVIGDYGAFVEFSHRPEDTVFISLNNQPTELTRIAEPLP